MSSSDNQLNIRVDAELKRAFIDRAKAERTTATELLVGFMKQYLGIQSARSTAIDTAAIERDLQERLNTCLAKRLVEIETSLGERLDIRLAEIRQQYLGESVA